MIADTTKPTWARIWVTARPDGSPRVRQGAWYPVLSQGANTVVLNVDGEPVDLPANLVETRKQSPDRFTVVIRPEEAHNPALGTKKDVGRVYAVCPRSATRIRLWGEPKELECPTCGHRGLVAWWETG